MNKIHRTVWSEARQCFVVASEAAKAKGKPSSKHSAAALKAAVALMALGGAGGVLAADLCTGGPITVNAVSADKCVFNVNGESITINAGGGLTPGAGSSAIGSQGLNFTAGNVDNSGQLSGDYGVQMGGTGVVVGNVINQTGGTITGLLSPVYAGDGSTFTGITNAGTITSSSTTRFAIELNHGQVAGNIVNQSGGVVSAVAGSNNFGIRVEGFATVGGNIDNAGTIIGSGRGISVVNHSAATAQVLGGLMNSATGTISGAAFAGVYINNKRSAGTTVTGGITNAGTIIGGASFGGAFTITDGITVVGGLSNEATGVINATPSTGVALALGNPSVRALNQLAHLRNAGQMGEVAIDGTNITNGITNTGTISGNNGIRMTSAVSVTGGLVNSGTITGTTQSVYFNLFNGALPSIDNQSTGLLDGQLAIYGTTHVTNAGTIAITAGSFIRDYLTVEGGAYTQPSSGVLRTKVTNSTTFGAMVVGGTATLPSNAKFDVLTGNASTCGGIIAGTTLAGVISAATLTWDDTYVVTDDCTSINFTAVRNGQAVDLVAVSAGPSSWAVTGATNNAGFGTVSCVSPVVEGASATCTGTASGGYQLNSAAGSNTLCGTVSSSGNTITAGPVTGACIVTGTFAAIPPSTYAITTAASPTAGGSVACSSNPVTSGGSSTCTGTANPGYIFSTFSGDCSGASCVLTNVTSAKSVTGVFTQNNYAITATANPTAGGTVTCTPSSVTYGNSSTCTATANPGYTFSTFSGDCSGSTCSLTNVTSAKSVTGNFVAATATQTNIPTSSTGVTATLAATGCTAINSAVFVNAPAGAPANTTFPFGLLDFRLTGCSGGSVSVTVTYSQNLPANAVFYKENNGSYAVYPTTAIGANSVTFNLTDGGAGDADGVADGNIHDPSGVGVAAALAGAPTSIPTLSEWGLIFLSSLMAMFGLKHTRRSRAGR